MKRSARIVSAAHYLPERRVTNADLQAHFAALGNPEVIGKYFEATGIEQRFYAPENWATSDLALPAAREAIRRAGRQVEDVDLLILGTDSPDYITPATSVVLQYKLGAVNAGTFDVGCACSSFPAALSIAAGLIATNPGINTVLVLGVYLMHKLADPDDPTVFFYGDGAGAVLLEAGEQPGYIGAAFQADGAFHDRWGIFAGGTAEPMTEAALKAGRHQVRMLQRYPPEVNSLGWPRLFNRLAAENGFSASDVDHLICTQVSRSTIETAAHTIGVPVEKCSMTMGRWGYTGSACIPMALANAMNQGEINAGELVVMIGSGVGYNQAACAFRMI